MDLTEILIGLTNTKKSPIVICDTDYRIVFMNDWAKKEYAPYGGEALIGQSLLTHCGFEGRTKVEMVIEWFKENNDKDSLFCYHKDESNTDVYLVAIRNKDRELIGFTGIYESRDPETIEGYVFD